MVVGGGIVGIACAHYLVEAGLRVVVIDQGKIGGACSQGNCGYICPSHIPPLTEPGAFKVALKSLLNRRSPFRVKPTVNPSLIYWMMQFALRCNSRQVLCAGSHLQTILDSSMAEYRSLLAREHFSCEWEDKGLLYVFRSEHAANDFAEIDRLLTDHFGVAAVRIQGKDLPAFDPGLREGLYGGFHYPHDASVRPDRLNQSWMESLKDKGVRFLEGCVFEEPIGEGGALKKLKTSQGILEGDAFVFAMGALSGTWSSKLGTRIPVQPGKGYSITLPRPPRCPRHPILFPEEKVGVSPFARGMRLGSMMEFVGYDSTIPEYRTEQLRSAARRYLVASVDAPAEETWFGWRPMTWDSLPIIGPLPQWRNAYLATGHNMIGLTLAPATGRLIAELVTGQVPHIDVSPYALSRF